MKKAISFRAGKGQIQPVVLCFSLWEVDMTPVANFPELCMLE